MKNTAEIISLLFFLGALLPPFWGLYMIRLDSKLIINRIFLLLSLALSVWMLGFAMANSQSTVEVALLWRRFAAIGWTSIFSLILHFFLLITDDSRESTFCKFRPLLYIPSLILMFVFSFSNKMSAVQYNLIKVDTGWINSAVNNTWDYLYYLFYGVYLAASIFTVWKWKNRLQDKGRIRQAKLLLNAIFFAAILGTLTDLIIPSYTTDSLPQLAPLFALFPVWAMYYSVRYHDILNMGPIKKEESILSTNQQAEVFRKLAIGLFLGGLVIFTLLFFSNQSSITGDLTNSLLRSSAILGLGIIILGVQKITDDWLREKLTLVILVASIPIVLFQFINTSTTTIWAYSFLILMGSLLFDKRFLLLSTTIIAIITQRLIWIIKGESYVFVGKYDYILRILFLITAFILGSYVNKVYIAKVRENREQITFLELVSAITYDLLTFNEKNSGEKIQHLLKKTGEFFDVDRTYLFTIDHANSTMTYSNEWCKMGIDPEIGTITEVPLNTFSWWVEQMKSNHLVKIEDVNLMPDEAMAEQKQLERQGVKSLIAVPIIENDKIYAFIGVDSVKEYKDWSDKKIELLNILANILANVLTPIQIDKQTKFMAYNDALTMLPNRFLFIDRVNQAIPLSQRTGKRFAIFFIDLDGFKSVNDTLGHEGGDILLQQVAQKLERTLRQTDTVARFGGDEFLIMINNIDDSKTIEQIADKIINVFAEEFLVQNQHFIVTASAGIAIYPNDGENSETLIRNADLAMYQAKIQGKNQYVFCTEEMKENDLTTQKLSADLSMALAREEFILHYQPQVDLLTNEISGVEALIRWMHPTKGLISPEIFIPLAEKNNLIDSIGEWVLQEATRQNKKWQDMGLPPINVAVNLSAAQIRNLSIAEKIKKITKDTGLDPKYIELEVTESVAIDDDDVVLDILNEIQQTGASITIDDFGTGYSSLSRLKQLPVDRLKIDMQFIQAIETSVKDQAIITTIIALAKSLDLTVVAEGVETAEQLAFLEKEQCDTVQGYYFYKPMVTEEIKGILQTLR